MTFNHHITRPIKSTYYFGSLENNYTNRIAFHIQRPPCNNHWHDFFPMVCIRIKGKTCLCNQISHATYSGRTGHTNAGEYFRYLHTQVYCVWKTAPPILFALLLNLNYTPSHLLFFLSTSWTPSAYPKCIHIACLYHNRVLLVKPHNIFIEIRMDIFLIKYHKWLVFFK